jgi:Tol biopolymer transport system component
VPAPSAANRPSTWHAGGDRARETSPASSPPVLSASTPADVLARGPLDPGAIIGPYVVERLIGAGGMGQVYKAHDTRLNRPVAIKIVHDGAHADGHDAARFRAEAHFAASLDHPYVCKIYELIDAGQAALIVMEFVDGEPLSSVLTRGVPPLADALRIGVEIAEGLADVHAHGLVHRDIKPSNVMITSCGHVKLLDFGLARLGLPSATETTRSTLTGPGVVVGTPLYMAPEQALGSTITHRTDLFSLGVVLFQCLTGELPFEGPTPDTYMREIEAGRVRSMRALAPGVPERVRLVVEQCLAADPARRPESAVTIATGLHGAADQLIARSAARTSRARLARAAMALPAMFVVGLAGVYYRGFRLPSGSPPPAIVAVTTAAGAETDGRISPDGRWVSFVSDRDGPTRLFTRWMDATTTAATAVEVPGEAVLSHAWSPDGRELAVVVLEGDALVFAVVAAFAKDPPRKRIRLAPDAARVRVIRWLGNDVFVEMDLGAGARALCRVNLATDEIANLTHDWPATPRFRSFDVSPDGQDVVAVGGEGEQSDLWRSKIDGSNLRRLTNDPWLERFPLWVGRTGHVVVQSNRGGQLDLWELDARSGQIVQRLTTSADVEEPTAATGDGSLVLFDTAEERAFLTVLEPGARRPQDVTADALSDFWPSVSRDGRVVAFQRTKPTVREGFDYLDTHILVQSLETTPAEPRYVGEGFSVTLSPDGSHVAYLQRAGGPKPDPRRNRLQVTNVLSGATTTVTTNAPMPTVSSALPVDDGEQRIQWAADGGALYFVTTGPYDQINRMRMADPGRTDVIVAPEGLRMRDIRVSPDGARLAYLGFTQNVFHLRVLDLPTGRDEPVQMVRGTPADVFLRGWTHDGRLLLLRSTLKPDKTYRLVVQAVTLDGSVRSLHTIDRAYVLSTRLDGAGRRLYFTAVDGAIHNIHVLDLTTGVVGHLTDNDRRGVSYSGVVPLADGTIVYSRCEWRRNIFRIVRATR